MFDPLTLIIGTIAGLAVNHSHQTGRVADASHPVTAPVASVSVIIPAYDEEQCIDQCLASLQAQNILQTYPERFEFIIAVDERTTDRTVEVAAAYGATVIYCPPGKLVAKEMGVAASQGDIIVFLDADVEAGPNMLNLLLEKFNDSEVVAASGVLLSQGITRLLDVQVNNMLPLFSKRLVGNVSAVRKNAWLMVGGYDLSIDQFDRKQMVQEEEVEISRKLQQVGKVVVDSEISVEMTRAVNPCQFCLSKNCDNAYCQQVRSAQRF